MQGISYTRRYVTMVTVLIKSIYEKALVRSKMRRIIEMSGGV